MHPVIIMSYDKSPAINEAVAALEAAGMEVRVLNTGHAKLAEFLGALAGEDDEGSEPKSDDKAIEKEPKAEPEESKAEPEETSESVKESVQTGSVDGETIKIVIVEGSDLILHPSDVNIGAKTSYTLNESTFAFWPKDMQHVFESVELVVGELDVGLTNVQISDVVSNPPVLMIGNNWLRENVKLHVNDAKS